MVVDSPLNAGLPLSVGLPTGKMLSGRIGVRTAVGMPSFWVQVEPWWSVSQVIFHSGVPCVPG